MGIRPGGRDTLNNTLLLGRATRDTVAVSGNVVDWWNSTRPSLFGQVVRVTSMLGPAAEATRRALRARKSTEVVVVPWGNDPGCGIYLWRFSAQWTTPDSAGLYTVRLRPESLWASGRPTFDAFYAGIYSYVIGAYTAGPHFAGWGPNGKVFHADAMTPAEVFALYMAVSDIKGPGDSAGIARAQTWVRVNRSIVKKFPGDVILPWLIDVPR